jgi:hypothetical protein
MFLPTLSRAGAAFGVGRAVMLNGCSRCPGRRNTAGQNRTRPPPCMRWRGPCLVSPRRAGQLPGLPGTAGPPASAVHPCEWPVTRSLSRPPESPLRWCPFPTVKVFLLPQRQARKGLPPSHYEFLRYPHSVHRTQPVIRSGRRLSTGYSQRFHTLRAVSGRILRPMSPYVTGIFPIVRPPARPAAA